MTDPLISILNKHPEYSRLLQALQKGEGPAGVFGLGDAHKGHVAAALAAESDMPLLLVAPNELAAGKLCDDISAFVPCVHFPAREIPLSGKGYTASTSIEARRIAILSALSEGAKMAVTVSIQALMQRVAEPEVICSSVNSFSAGQVIDPKDMLRSLVEAGYERVEVCENRGQVCRRGGYVDVFPMTGDTPVRIEFFDDEIDTLRTYDPVTQRSIDSIESIVIPPATEMPITSEARAHAIKLLKKRGASELLDRLQEGGRPDNPVALLPLFYPGETTLLDYFKDGCILIDEPARVEESGKIAWQEFLDGVSPLISSGEAQPEQANLIISPLDTIKRLDTRRTAMFFALTRTYGLIGPKCIFKFETRPVSKYIGREELLCDDIAAWKKSKTTVLIYAGSHAKRLQDRLLDLNVIIPVKEALDREIIPGEALIIEGQVNRGFEYPELSLAVISESELYGSENRRSQQKKRRKPQLVFSELSVGDLVVHELHGIGRFIGVETLNVGGVQKDYLHLVYSGGDKLYIPTDQLDRVQKYIGGEEETQRLSKLGSGEWQKTVSRTKESVKRLAFDLVRLYGERQKRKGFKFSPDTSWQKKLEDSFPYDETPDQLTSIEEIKADMESDKVMDRLLCGDVGYGKTEVALRAAFKAVMDSKQVAILVPTTILAQQHYGTIAARFDGFPVRVELLSRFKTPKEEAAILEGLEKGSVDVVVGTHKLLGKNVKFKDLGLLIVDEEQRFGVGHKEQIKNIRQSVDVLTLSATPIPRTLHMSMTGIRDMSVMETPPSQRYPVQTYVMEYSEAVVREAILKEVGRGGQVYFVYNNVRNMERFAAQLKELVPEAEIAFAHGQMNERVLEKTMLEFMEHKYDLLLCSTIIESGLDIQNVNTIIIYDADCMGLSQLYQLRGRVGRGVRLGYAYMMYKRNKVMNETAEKRLVAIRDLTQFGSGFKVALRDLEIRGAGNLLGPEQHGHMEAIGYDLYCKIVDSAVREAKGEPVPKEIDTVMEIPIPANIPHSYIPREAERLSMYKRIAFISSQPDVYDVQDELIDRYGEIPKEVQNLVFVALLKADAKRAHIQRLAVKPGEVRIVFDPEAPIDGAKLYSTALNIFGAAMVMDEVPTMVIRRPRTSVEELCSELTQIVYMLSDCIVK